MREDQNTTMDIDVVDYFTAEATIPLPSRDRDSTRDVKFRFKFNLTEQTPSEQARIAKLEEDGGLGAVVEDRLQSVECLTPNQTFKYKGDVIECKEWFIKSPIGQQWCIKRFWDKVNSGIKPKN